MTFQLNGMKTVNHRISNPEMLLNLIQSTLRLLGLFLGCFYGFVFLAEILYSDTLHCAKLAIIPMSFGIGLVIFNYSSLPKNFFFLFIIFQGVENFLFFTPFHTKPSLNIMPVCFGWLGTLSLVALQYITLQQNTRSSQTWQHDWKNYCSIFFILRNALFILTHVAETPSFDSTVHKTSARGSVFKAQAGKRHHVFIIFLIEYMLQFICRHVEDSSCANRNQVCCNAQPFTL